MKIFLPLLFITSLSFGQTNTDKITDSIVREGKMLYKSEMASWYGTDIFLEKFKEQKENIGGYFSYSDKDSNHCVFFSKETKVLGVISFDNTYNVEKAQINREQREFTTLEKDLYQIRTEALAEINKSDSFKRYQNTNFNIIPLICNGIKKVYVLTGPKVTGVVIFGNDYLLTYDDNNKLIKTQQLHKNLIPINYNKEQGEDVVAIHSHLPETGDFITATDICTLMLYEKISNWKQHIVMAENYVSIWDCKKDELITLTKRAWEKIYKIKEEKKAN